MRRKAVLVAAAVVLAAAGTGAGIAAAATGLTDATVYACINSTARLDHVNTASPQPCPSGQPVQWAGQVPASPSPTATSPSPSPTATTASPTPTGTGTGGAQCVTSQPTGTPCQLAAYPGITGSNGYDTYGGNNCWADPSCAATSTFYDPGNWNTQITEPAGNTAVKAYPTVQELESGQAVSAMTVLSSGYAETMNPAAGTVAWAGYDLWLDNWADEVLVAVDNHGIDPSYLPLIGQFTTPDGKTWTAYSNGSERVVVADTSAGAGTVDLLAVLRWLQGAGRLPSAATLTAVDFGWEVCSTGGAAETFAVSGYTLDSR